MLALWAVYLWTRSQPESLQVLATFFANLVLAVPIYFLVPVCGPAFAFRNFPWQIPLHLEPHRMVLYAAANGIPSVHTSTALLIVWFARRWKLGRILAPLYLALILLATMASGQHYFFDLVTAVPYAWIIYWITSKVLASLHKSGSLYALDTGRVKAEGDRTASHEESMIAHS